MDHERLTWFEEARFGLFIHWGLYAIPARGAWSKQTASMSDADYQIYFDTFCPDRYDPRGWARAARQAGMKYAVMTAKHHDGFCLFDSKHTDYKAPNTQAGRDLIREYVDAFRAEGIRIGFYYSLLDWHHPDYPVSGDPIHPMRNNPEFKDRTGNMPRYADYMRKQITELLSNYGPVAVMWLDFSYGENGLMSGEVWKATELVRTIRRLQPEIVLNARLGGNVKATNPEIYAGDLASPEQIIPPEGVLNESGVPIPWEACMTMNDSWGYVGDKGWKSVGTLIRALVECVSKGGNLLLNVGPNPKGEIPDVSLRLLEEIADWMRRNGESIYGCGRAGLPKPEWGRFTRRGNTLYAHVLDRGIGPVNLRGLRDKVKYARLLSDDTELLLNEDWFARNYPEDAFVSLKTAHLPDARDTVVKLALTE